MICDTAFPRQVQPCSGAERNTMHLSCAVCQQNPPLQTTRTLTEQCHQHRRLPRASRANDQIDFPGLEDNLIVDAQSEATSVQPGRTCLAIVTGVPCEQHRADGNAAVSRRTSVQLIRRVTSGEGIHQLGLVYDSAPSLDGKFTHTHFLEELIDTIQRYLR